MKMNKTVLFLLAALMPTCAINADDPLVSDLAKLEGTWLADIDHDTTAELVLGGGKMTYVWIHQIETGSKRQLIWIGTYVIDPTTSPKQMTWLAKNPGKPNAPMNNAIYRIVDDLLLIIGNNRGKRPTKFYSGGKGHPTTVIFRRKPSA